MSYETFRVEFIGICKTHAIILCSEIISSMTLLKSYSIQDYTFSHYNTSVTIIDLVCNTTFFKCIHFIHKRRYVPFKVDSEGENFFENLFMAIFIPFTEFLPEMH